MSAAVRFRQADLTRAIRAARKGGIEDPRVEIEPGGKIVIMAAAAARPAANPWDEVLEE
ncbi:MAG: hypothetical protein AB7O91_03910 [Sphingomonas sp.]